MPRPTTRSGFAPTRRALSRIAKEGRKYGVSLGLVTQRPAELDPTIISQCSTLFVMRMANEEDQALLRSAVSDAAANLLVLRALARHRRGGRLRRGHAAAGPPHLQEAAGEPCSGQRVGRREELEHSNMSRGRGREDRYRALAKGDDRPDRLDEEDASREPMPSIEAAQDAIARGLDAIEGERPPAGQRAKPLDPRRYTILKR